MIAALLTVHERGARGNPRGTRSPTCLCATAFAAAFAIMVSVRLLLVTLIICALVNAGLFGRMLHLGNPGGALMKCLSPPCERAYTLWLALATFTFVGCVAARVLLELGKPNMTVPSNAIMAGTIAVAVANLAVDVHYAHPIPHGGKSLNWAMYSDVAVEEQALTPLITVIVSVLTMGLNIICHRILTDDVTRKGVGKKAA